VVALATRGISSRFALAGRDVTYKALSLTQTRVELPPFAGDMGA